MSIIKDNHLTLFRDLREAYRKAHQSWVKRDYKSAAMSLREGMRIATSLLFELNKEKKDDR